METAFRDQLEDKCREIIQVNPDLTRSLVSYQANKKLPIYRWFKFKEAFSAPMVEYFLIKSYRSQTGVFLDPFAGSCSALFVMSQHNWKAIGIGLLPLAKFVIKTREAIRSLLPAQLKSTIRDIQKLKFQEFVNGESELKELTITKGAYPKENEQQLIGYLKENSLDENLNYVLRFAAFSILESISFTRKDGQYLR